MNTVCLLVLAIAALLAAVVFKRHKSKRRKDLYTMTIGLDVKFEEYGPELQLLENTGLPLFIEGYKGFGKNFLRFPQQEGFESYFFDYICLAGGPEKQGSFCGTVALFDFANAQFPVFYLAAENDLRKPAIRGFEPVDTSAFAGFPAGAGLYGSDSAVLRAFFKPETAALFKKEAGWSAQGAGRYLLLHKGSKLVSPGNYMGFVEAAKTMAFRLA